MALLLGNSDLVSVVPQSVEQSSGEPKVLRLSESLVALQTKSAPFSCPVLPVPPPLHSFG